MDEWLKNLYYTMKKAIAYFIIKSLNSNLQWPYVDIRHV